MERGVGGSGDGRDRSCGGDARAAGTGAAVVVPASGAGRDLRHHPGRLVPASTDPADPLSVVAWAVVVTLVVYSLAERWSELLGTHLRGEPLTRRRIAARFSLILLMAPLH